MEIIQSANRFLLAVSLLSGTLLAYEVLEIRLILVLFFPVAAHLFIYLVLLGFGYARRRSPGIPSLQPERQTVMHRLACLVHLGACRGGYFGRKKTLFLLLMAATIANLTLIAIKTGQMGANPSKPRKLSNVIHTN